MATKKLAFGGMSNMRSKVKQMSSMAKRPQARAIDNKNAPSMEQLMAAKQAMLGNQKGQSQQVGGLGDAMLKSGARPGLGSIAGTINPSTRKITPLMKKGGMTKGYADGGMAMVDKEKNPGLAKLPTEVRNKMGYMKKGGDVKHEDVKMDKKVVKKAVGMHEKQLHAGKKSNLTKLKSGGSIDGCAVRGKTKTSMVKMKKGGSC